MYISPISFTSKKYSRKINNKNSKQTENKPSYNIKKRIGCTSVVAAAILTALFLGEAGMGAEPVKNTVKIPYNSNNTSLTEIAETYDISEDAIKFYNDISDNKPLDDVKEIKIPSSFDYLSDRIKTLQEKLHSAKLSEKERTNTEKTVSALQKKREEQENVAITYSDGEFIYICIDFSETVDDEIKEKYEFGINIESLKKLFDIKEGGIENNNDINSRIEIYSDNETKSYKDFTRNWFHNGDIIKVPLESIQMNDIDLESYY